MPASNWKRGTNCWLNPGGIITATAYSPSSTPVRATAGSSTSRASSKSSNVPSKETLSASVSSRLHVSSAISNPVPSVPSSIGSDRRILANWSPRLMSLLSWSPRLISISSRLISTSLRSKGNVSGFMSVSGRLISSSRLNPSSRLTTASGMLAKSGVSESPPLPNASPIMVDRTRGVTNMIRMRLRSRKVV